MSRTGKKPIAVDPQITVKIDKNSLLCEGPKGKMSLNIPAGIEVNMEDKQLKVFPSKPARNLPRSLVRSIEKQKLANWGTVRQAIQNSIQGVSKGFEKVLLLEGVGFRAAVKGQLLTLNVGYSYPMEYGLPEKASAKVDGNTKLIITSCDRQLLGKIAAEIRAIRPPEPYKGKGIRYENETIVRKAGKTGKK